MEKNPVKKSLRFSLWDGVFASCMSGLTQEYFTPYALALKAQASQIGFLTAFPNIVSSLFQLKSADLTDRVGSRKKIILICIFLQACMLIPIFLLPVFFSGMSVTLLIVLVTLFTCCNAFAIPVWLSLMSDYLPYKKRGAYFGWRNKVLVSVTIVCMFAAGFILHWSGRRVLSGFLVIFAAACILRFVSGYFFSRMYEPRQHFHPDAYFSFIDFIKRAKESNFARFVFFVSSLTFAVNLAAPFFSLLMLRDLQFNYLTYTMLVITVSIAQIATIERWGRNADRIGNIKVLRIASLVIASLPFWWIIWQHPVYLAFAQVLSGIAWAGFNLCAINFIYDAVTPAKRTRCIAYFNVFNGVAVCLGSLAGGFLATRLPNVFGFRLLTLFFISGALRFVIALSLPKAIKEVRHVEKMSTRDLIARVVGLKPTLD